MAEMFEPTPIEIQDWFRKRNLMLDWFGNYVDIDTGSHYTGDIPQNVKDWAATL